MKMLEISVQKKYEKKRKILASEVNDKALSKTDVNVLIKQITDAELDLNTKVTGKSVKKVMELYQKAIEYYSALDNKCYEDFLNRMTNLFKREEIQIALAAPDEEEKKEEEEEENQTETQKESNDVSKSTDESADTDNNNSETNDSKEELIIT